MTRNRTWKIVLLLAVPLALYVYNAERNSWRPRTMLVDAEPRHMQFSPDGRTLLIYDWSNEFRGDVLLCDVATGAETGRITVTNDFCCIENGKFIAAFCAAERAFRPQEERLKIFSVPDGKYVASGPKDFLPLGVLADESTLIGMIADSRNLYRWNWRTDRTPRLHVRLSKEPQHFLWMLPDHTTLQDGGNFIDLATGKLRFQIKREPDTTYSLFQATYGYSTSLVALNNGGKAQIWNYKTGRLQSPVGRAASTISGGLFALSSDDTLLAGGSTDEGLVNLWDVRTGTLVRQIKGTQDNVYCLAFSPDGRTLAAASDDGTVTLWRSK